MRSWAERTGISGGETISFEQCWALAKRWYLGRDRLDWRPKTVAEMRAIFDAVGLADPFWRLGD